LRQIAEENNLIKLPAKRTVVIIKAGYERSIRIADSSLRNRDLYGCSRRG